MEIDKYEISIIIVNYKTPELLYNCIKSIYECNTDVIFEIIVIDNDSRDKSKTIIQEHFPQVVWIGLETNSGFARANNIGIKRAQGSYILLLNSDTVLTQDCIRKTIDYHRSLEEQQIKAGFVSCKMKDLNGNILFNSNLSFPGIDKAIKANPLYIYFTRNRKKNEKNKEEKKEIQQQKTHEAKWMGAAFLLFKRETCFKETLFLDEDFFMYGEDVELHFRAVKKGYHNFFFAGVEIGHVNCGSSTDNVLKTNQIIISDWLCILKTKGRFYYFNYFLQLYINYLFNIVLHTKSRLFKKTNIAKDNIDYKIKNNHELLKKYGLFILKNYRKKPSSGTNSLRYVQ
jgi:GT2 family glycosyltransferase